MYYYRKKISITLLAIGGLLFSCHAHPGVGIVMDSKGNVFFTDLKQVWKIDLQGKKTVAVPNVHTHELYMDEFDNLFGEHLWYNGEKLDTWGHFVWKLSAVGTYEKIIPNTEGFLNGYSFVRDHFGRMYWADRTKDCQKLARKNTDKSVTLLGDECFHNIRWMTSTRDGVVYLMDLFDLKKVDARGHVKTIARGLQERDANLFTFFQPNDPHLVMGVWLDNEQSIYAAVPGGRVVKKITQSGEVTEVVATPSPWSPNGGMVAPNGDLWILESGVMGTYQVRVERITKAGKRIIY